MKIHFGHVEHLLAAHCTLIIRRRTTIRYVILLLPFYR